MPPRVPLAGGIQPAVHRLVTAALLLFSAATALSPAFAHQPPGLPSAVTSSPAGRSGGASPAATPPAAGPATPAPATPASAGRDTGRPGLAGRDTGPPGLAGRDTGPGLAGRDTGPGLAGRDTGPPGPGGPGELGGAGAPASGQERPLEPAHHRVWRTGKIYVVQPPEGRYHESLWEIAQNHLGDGRRYREIFELNAGRLQPDGSRLTIASLIRPGWILRMPRDAHGPRIRVVTLHEQAHGPGGDGTAG